MTFDLWSLISRICCSIHSFPALCYRQIRSFYVSFQENQRYWKDGRTDRRQRTDGRTGGVQHLVRPPREARIKLIVTTKTVIVKSFPEPQGPMGRRWSLFNSLQPGTSLSCTTTDTGLVYRVVCPFTPQLSLVLINRPRRDGTLSWRWCTAAAVGIRTHDPAVASAAPYHSATAHLTIIKLLTISRTRKLCYRKDDRAMRAI